MWDYTERRNTNVILECMQEISDICGDGQLDRILRESRDGGYAMVGEDISILREARDGGYAMVGEVISDFGGADHQQADCRVSKGICCTLYRKYLSELHLLAEELMRA